jgi:hypothetical protein
MLNSAINFALGFFGYPLDGKYQQSITIEANGVSSPFYITIATAELLTQFNNTLSPYKT